MNNIIMKTSDDGTNTIIDVFGTIGDSWFGDSTTSKQVINAVRESKSDTIQLNINSGGGSVFEGMAMYDALRDSKAKVTARVLGFAGSMATIVMLAADTVEVVDGALIMIHNPSVIADGESKDLRKQADNLDKLQSSMANIYDNKMNVGLEEVIAMMNEETWLSAEEAHSLGLIDKIVEYDKNSSKDAKAYISQLDLTASSPAAKIPLRFAASISHSVSVSPNMGTVDEDKSINKENPLSILDDIKELLGLEDDANISEIHDAIDELEEDEDADQDKKEDEDKKEDIAPADAVASSSDEIPSSESGNSIPKGMVMVDEETLEFLKAVAARQVPVDDKSIVSKAVDEGRIPAARYDHYLTALELDRDTFLHLLTADESDGGLAKGLIPVNEIGTAHDENSQDNGSVPVAYDPELFPQLNNSKNSQVIETE